MKTNELRIGNWVLARLVPYQIDEIEIKSNGYGRVGLYHNYRLDRGEIQPIPLSEKWLLKFGFKRIDMMFENEPMLYWRKGHLIINDERRIILFTVKEAMLTLHCEYVHQLQNLYFALTGEELIIKDDGKV